MPRFSVIFGLSNSQAQLDFVDILTETDNPLYLDPYAIQIRDDQWSGQCGDLIRSFFNEVLDALRGNNIARARHLLGNLHEPNETCLGQSKGMPSGRGVGIRKANDFADALISSRAFQTGILSDMSEAELFIHGIGPDTISDLTTNILRGLLAEYTSDQCKLHGIPTTDVRNIGPVWNPTNRDWEASVLTLPIVAGRPILLVPKFSVRRRLSLDSQEFYNFHMVEYLQREYLSAGAALVQTFKDGTPYVTKISVKTNHPFIKDDLAGFVRDHPEVLERYKNLKGAEGSLETEDLDIEFDEGPFARALIERIQEIPSGSDHATEYHSVVTGVCTFLFYPQLIYPVKEREIHNGRKRVDIKFTNTGRGGVFQRLLQGPQTRALNVMIECKNYSSDIGNPELDQLQGRFGHQRGFFGMLLCRTVQNKARLVERCRDTASDGRGFMIALDDTDIIAMLEMVEANNRVGIDRYIGDKFEEISL